MEELYQDNVGSSNAVYVDDSSRCTVVRIVLMIRQEDGNAVCRCGGVKVEIGVEEERKEEEEREETFVSTSATPRAAECVNWKGNVNGEGLFRNME